MLNEDPRRDNHDPFEKIILLAFLNSIRY